MTQEVQSSPEPLHLLAETSVGTPMGRLLRTFWHPIAMAKDVKMGTAQPVRVLGEDLTIYRGESGQAYLIGGRCAHRRTVLHTGIVSGEQISCMYHGWRYNGQGRCIEIPAEKRPRAEPLTIPSYPVHEYGGLVFAYLGPTPAPEFNLPRKPEIEDPKHINIPTKQVWDCNWFQQIENSLDAVHVSFVHRWGHVKQFGAMVSATISELAYTETSAGIRQVATRSPTNVRISDWTFPNCNHILAPPPTDGDPWFHANAWQTPIDDTRTMRFAVFSVDRDWAAGKDVEDLFAAEYSPMDEADALFGARGLERLPEAALQMAQDYVAIRGQGVVYDRSHENLSTSDAGIAFLRHIFLRELEALMHGRPTKHWRRLDETLHMTSSGRGCGMMQDQGAPYLAK